ncbi:MAG TPA: class F sortase, partial [Pseudonocardiaceae bacterium]|nr:class F sortase [Pseudonocardiaceae bacterium]
MTRQQRPGRSLTHPIAAFVAAIGLLGAVLLIAGSVQAAQANTIVGIPAAVPDTHPALPAPGDRHQQAATPPAPAPIAPPSNSSSRPSPRSSAAPGPQPANTIRLPHGDVAALVQEPVAADGSLPIPPGVHEATWWGVGFDASSGATLFAGHVNWAGSIGPFAELWQDTVGGIVTVADG